MTETTNASATTSGDVISFLVQQHQEVRQLLAEVLTSVGTQRQQAFDTVREMLARHETAEEMVVRPLTRKIPDGASIAQGRMDEENDAKKELAELEKLDVSSPEFATAFSKFQAAVERHATAEEQLEFPALRNHTEPETLSSAQQKVEKAEKTAPTHPHPSAKTTAMNYVAGPFAAMLDRARDAFSKNS
jgi:iron-sulfur cluster repair protein YtfE (RIC family)